MKKSKKILLGMTLALILSTVSFGVGKSSTKSASNITNMSTNNGNTLEAGPNIALVETQAGKIQGYIRNGIETFRGVPYATAERFMEPKKLEKWSGVKLTVKNGPISMQNPYNPFKSFFFSGPELTMSEDPLNLNIWTPSTTDNKKRAVMVWIHGGGHQAGSSMESYAYDGENLSKKGDIVVVSVNHRLNSVGNLDLSSYGGKYKNTSNLEVKDMVASLEWIRDNITKFGGDPNNVTLFGESGGGGKILTLMGTPAAKGLFHKGILQSGAAETIGMSLPTTATSKRVAELTLQNLGIKPSEIDKIQTVPFVKLEEASNKAMAQTAKEQNLKLATNGQIGLLWSPIVDGKYIPESTINNNKFTELAKDIPMIIGSNLTEFETIDAGFFSDSNIGEAQSNNKNNWSAVQIENKIKEKYGNKAEEIKEAFRKAYPDRNIADVLYVDSLVRTPALKTAKIKSEQGGAPVYNYIFSWDTLVMGGFAMSYHTSEISFVMNNAKNYEFATGGGKEALALADKMSQAWINFAKTGNPNVTGQPRWETYNRKNGATMIFDNKLELKHNHDLELMKILVPDYEF